MQQQDPAAPTGGGGAAAAGRGLGRRGVAPAGAQDAAAQGEASQGGVPAEPELREGRRPHGAEESPATMDVVVEPDGCDSQASRAAAPSGVLQAGGTWPRG